jgi:hypothetical protein
VHHDLDHSIARVRARVSRAVFGVTLLFWLAILAGICACIALGLRVALGWEASRAALAFVPLVIAPLIALRNARRRTLTAAGAAAWLDVRAGADGSVVTGFESGDGAWRARTDAALMRAVDLPRARLARPAALFAGAVLFAALALLVPISRGVPGPSRALAAAAIEKAEEKLATLEEEVELQPELAAELHASLDRLKEENSGSSNESVFEAADRVAEKLSDEAASLSESSESVQRELAEAAAAAAGDPEAAQEELESALRELAKSGLSKGLADVMTSELGLESLELPPGTKLDAAQIARTSAALRARLGDKLGKLAAAGLLKEGKPAREGEPRDIEVAEHVCDAECAKKPGGT